MENVAEDLIAREKDLNSLATITLLVILTAVSMTFGSLIVVFVVRALTEEFWSHIQLPAILWFSTVILLVSSYLFHTANKALRTDQSAFHRLISWTFCAGFAFLITQTLAGVQILGSGVRLRNNPHSSFIFIFAGLHAVHILVGLLGMGILWHRTRQPASGPRYQIATRATSRGVAIFWHFMDFMWIVLFGLLLFWRR